MKPSLQLKFSQQLTMTPQLQQAIRLLQLSTLDLQQEIQEALESNPLLEMEEGGEVSSNQQAEEFNSNDSLESGDALEKSEIPDELPVDSTWDEYYSASSAPAPSSAIAADDEQVFQGETTDSIQDHLLWQMRLTHFSETDVAIAVAIIDAIDEAGYLTCSTEDILQSLAVEEGEVELDEVECVLKRIQMFDPIG